MLSNWIYRKSDSVFLRGGFCEFTYDAATEGLQQFADADQPDRVKHRFDAVLGKRLATAQELSDAATADTTARAQATSRQKDVLATCAEIVRARGIAAWNAMTAQEKVNATLAEADVWKNIRTFIEANLP